jgi:hypothetical protein
MRRDPAKPLKSEPGRFVLAIFGVVVLILSFGVSLAFFGRWDQTGSDQCGRRGRKLLQSAVAARFRGCGFHLISELKPQCCRIDTPERIS